MELTGPRVDRELLDFLVRLAHDAGLLARERFYADTHALVKKADGTEVTAADVAVEEFICQRLVAAVPDDGVYGEETAELTGRSGRRWVIDPIDGTSYFARRIPLFHTTIAYEDEHGPAAAVINSPVAEHLVYAARGQGCWVGTGPDLDAAVPGRVSSTIGLGGALTGMSNPMTWPEELLVALHRKVFLFGALVGPMALVSAEIDADVSAGFPMAYEDLAPLPVIIAEAGGVVTDLSGAPLLTGDGTVLATNPALHPKYVELLAELPRVRDWRALRESR